MFDPHRGCYIQNSTAWRDSEIADDQLRKRWHQRSHVISYCAYCSLQTKAKRLEKSEKVIVNLSQEDLRLRLFAIYMDKPVSSRFGQMVRKLQDW